MAIYLTAARANKYQAVKTLYRGISYHSQKEANYAAELDYRLKARDIRAWERQKRLILIANNRPITVYIIDFIITHNDGSQEYVETKGFETEVFKLKRKLFEATYLLEHPEIKYTVVK